VRLPLISADTMTLDLRETASSEVRAGFSQLMSLWWASAIKNYSEFRGEVERVHQQNAETTERLRSTTESLRSTTELLRSATERLESVLLSSSWRYTGPLRWFKTVIKGTGRLPSLKKTSAGSEPLPDKIRRETAGPNMGHGKY
jgi:hypothetical protein